MTEKMHMNKKIGQNLISGLCWNFFKWLLGGLFEISQNIVVPMAFQQSGVFFIEFFKLISNNKYNSGSVDTLLLMTSLNPRFSTNYFVRISEYIIVIMVKKTVLNVLYTTFYKK